MSRLDESAIYNLNNTRHQIINLSPSTWLYLAPRAIPVCYLEGICLRRIIMIETILGLTVLNTVLILYMYRVIKNHHFYYGRPEQD